MKKSFISLLLCGSLALCAQQNEIAGLRAGAHVAIPLTDKSVNAGIDVSYLWEISPKFGLGISTGYDHYFVTKKAENFFYNYGGYIYDITFEYPDYAFIPIGVAMQYNFSGRGFAALDAGIAFQVNNGSEGGKVIYVTPKIGINKNNFRFFIFLKGLIDVDEIAPAAGIGFNYKL